DPDRDLAVALLDAAHELGAEARLAHPGLRDHHHGPGPRLRDALVEDPGQRVELPGASDVHGWPAEERPRALERRALAAQHLPDLELEHVEPRVEEPGAHVVER